ncbi:hypothetical protein GCM10022213_19580 [Parerythrobacter jejuensis]
MQPEQRAEQRFTLLLRQAKLRTRSGEFLCVLRDVSTRGISVRTFHALPPDRRFAVELQQDKPFLIEKAWENEGEAGFWFKDRVDLNLLLEDDPAFPRRQIRVGLDMPIQLQSGPETGSATLFNLSQQGACFSADRSWARDQLLRLVSPALPEIRAKVRWRQGDLHGVVFEDTFTFREFAALLGRLRGLA